MGSIEESWMKPRQIGVGTFSPPTDTTREYINDVLDSGRISYGKYSQEFERRFAALHGCQYAILSNSGTSALQIALQAASIVNKWCEGQSVIVPATTFVATSNIVIHNNLEPVFVDVDEDTYNINPTLIAERITDETAAIIPVHLFGHPADVYNIRHVLQEIGREDIKIIEDSCECMFVKHYGRVVGSLGEISCFSTYVAHLIVTGVGGLSLTNNSAYAGKMRSLANHGLKLEYLNPDENFAPRPTPNRRFVFDSVGHSYRITEFEAAIGLAQLDTCAAMMATRQRNARHITARLEQINEYYGKILKLPIVRPNNEHAWMMYPIVLEKDRKRVVDKEHLMRYLNSYGIETRDMLPLINQPIYSYLNRNDFPVSDWLVSSGFYIGCHQEMTPDDCDYIGDVFARYYDKGKV